MRNIALLIKSTISLVICHLFGIFSFTVRKTRQTHRTNSVAFGGKNFSFLFHRTICAVLLVFSVQALTAQNLKLTDFAIWGGGASPNPYNSAQGVLINNTSIIEGNIGSNHLIDIKNNFTLKGNIYSGNRVILNDFAKITGNIFANKLGTNLSPTVSANNNTTITGNLTANGKITIASGNVTGTVAVPAPANTNYSGPVPSGAVVTTFTLPTLPSMPNNTPFDNQAGTVNITTTRTISPGKYRKLALTGNRTIIFDGPGNYIFNDIDNGKTTNKFVFDFKNTSTGTINIFIINDARLGLLSVSTVNGNFPSRIFTEVHGNGSTFGGNSFDLQGPNSMPAGSYVWLGNIWAPNGGISIANTRPAGTAPHIIGALWSGKLVTIKNDLRLTYVAPAADPSYIDPYYTPPVAGKVDADNNVIGAELFSLTQNPPPPVAIPDNEIFRFDNSGTVLKVMIEVIVNELPDTTAVKNTLTGLGMTDMISNGPHKYVLTGKFPVNNLTQLNGKPGIRYVRPLYPPINNAGIATTQGDSTMRSNIVRNRFGLDGTGVKVGVISDSYNSKLKAQDDVDQGDLPGIKSSTTLPPNENLEPVQAPSPDLISGSDEGRAMLQIVHDVAPMAKLAFRSGFLTAGDFARNIQELASPSLPGGPCDIIVDDITYITEPFLRDGIVAQTVNQVVEQGVTYFSSAGNFGQQSYEGVFNGVTNSSVVPTGQIHKFGANAADIYQTINLKPGSYTIVLQWSDEFRSLGSTVGVQTDMDLYLVGANGFTLFGFNRSNLIGDPFEVCPFTVNEETNAKLMVVRAAGTASVRFKYIIFRGPATIMDYQSGTSSIVGHPNADSAIAVGAMLYANIPPFTPVWPGVAAFSSRGGTFTLQPNNTFAQRNKPEIVGPNGVNTTVNLGGPVFNDGDAYPNFFGTSAAAPHVAAVAALLIQGRKKFLQSPIAETQVNVTPYEIRQQLITSAGKFSPAVSFSYEGGYGYAQADSAISQIANARPIISSLEAVTAGAQNGTDSFQVKIKGRYLTANTEIYYYGKPVTTTISLDKTEAIATIPAIANGQDPPFQLYNPPKSVSEKDGGLSEALHFFSSVVNITIRAENKNRKYGQNNPSFTAEVLYNGVPVTNPDTLAKLKLDGNNLSFTTIASSSSNAGLYGIFPSRTTPLANDDPLLSQYGFTFVSGTLSIEKMRLKITPRIVSQNKQMPYGSFPDSIEYTYELDQSTATLPTLLDDVKTLHKKYVSGNGFIVLNGFNNQYPPISSSDLANMSTMASFQSVRNARKFVLEDGHLQPIANTIDTSLLNDQRFFVDVSTQSLENYKTDSAKASLVEAGPGLHARGFLNIKALTTGSAKASVPNGQLQAMVNGQLLAMVNDQSLPIVNGQLMAMVNGQLQAIVNGQLLGLVNGQLMALVNGQLEIVQGLSLSNGQLQALVNGQLQALVNGQLQAMVNGVVTDIPTNEINLVNGQLQAMVNGQWQALVNGQLQAIVNGETEPLINGAAVEVTKVIQLANGQLQALVNGTYIPITNGQLQAIVNGQLLGLVNGQLMAIVNGEVTFAVFVNGQLQALVNGQLQALVNGQLQAMVNGQLQALVNSSTQINNSYQIVDGQLQAIVNGQTWAYANGQLLGLVNGQLQGLVNNFDVSGNNNNSKTVVLVDQDDINLQAGGIGAMFSMNMITGLGAGLQTVIPGAFVNENFEVSYGLDTLEILKAPITVRANDTTKVYGDPNPEFTLTYSGLKYDDDATDINTPPVASTTATVNSGAGPYPITLSGGSSANYSFTSYLPGTLTIGKKTLNVTADDKTKVAGNENPLLTISYDGLVDDDTEDSVCIPFVIPPSPTEIMDLNRRTTYNNVRLNSATNFINASPGQSITLTGDFSSVYSPLFNPDGTQYCPGCITQIHIGLSNGSGGNVFNQCFPTNNGSPTPNTGSINITFNAPTAAGVYYLTQESTWWNFCGQFADPVHANSANKAIAIVVVNVSKTSITASVAADIASPTGDYPITLQGCENYNANYNVVLHDGTLTVVPSGATNARLATPSGYTRENTITRVSGNKLYPNPVSSLLRLQLEDDVKLTTDIQVYDMLGKLHRMPVNRVSGKIYEINVAALTKGVYFIKAKTSGGVIKTFRFMKL